MEVNLDVNLEFGSPSEANTRIRKVKGREESIPLSELLGRHFTSAQILIILLPSGLLLTTSLLRIKGFYLDFRRLSH